MALCNSLIRVESKEARRHASDRGERLNSVVAQFEVLVPKVTSRMEEGHDLSGLRID